MYDFFLTQAGFVVLAIVTPLLVIALIQMQRMRWIRLILLTLLPFPSGGLAISLFYRASVWLAGREDGIYWHWVFAGIAAVAAVIPFILRRAPVVLACLPFSGILAVLLAWSAYAAPVMVRTNIMGIALKSPFCVSQVTRGENIPGGGHYPLMRPVSSMNQFNYLTFGQSDSKLVIERPVIPPKGKLVSPVSVHDWRSDGGDFDPEVTGYVLALGGMTGCIPRKGFLDSAEVSPDRELVLFDQVWQGNEIVRTDQVRLRIPIGFRPAHGDFGGHNLVIASDLPDFAPSDPEALQDHKKYQGQVLYFGNADLPQDMRAFQIAEEGAMYIPSPEDGTALETRPVDGNGLHSHEDTASDATYYARYRDTGEWITSIRCYLDRCEHFFLPEIAIPGFFGPIVFRYPPEMLPQWRDMETALEARFRSFVVTD